MQYGSIYVSSLEADNISIANDIYRCDSSSTDQKVSIQPDIGDSTLVATNGVYTIAGNITFINSSVDMNNISESFVPATTSIKTVGTSSKTYLNMYTDSIIINAGEALTAYKKERVLLTFPSTSVFATAVNVAATCILIGTSVLICIDGINNSAGATQSTFVTASGIPALYRPASTREQIIKTFDASGSRSGIASVDSSGNIVVYCSTDTTTQWGTTSNNGWSKFTMRYNI
jgi:hypothetical protein